MKKLLPFLFLLNSSLAFAQATGDPAILTYLTPGIKDTKTYYTKGPDVLFSLNGSSNFALIAKSTFQAALISGVNLKTVQGNSLLGGSDIVLVVDAINDAILESAPSQNAVFDALALKANTSHTHAYTTLTGVPEAVLIGRGLGGGSGTSQAIVPDPELAISGQTIGLRIESIDPKATPVAGDLLIISDSEDGMEKKSIQISDLPSGGGTVTDVTATTPVQSTGGATPDISVLNSTGGNGATDSGKLLMFGTDGSIMAATAVGTSFAVYGETSALNTPAVHGFSTNSGDGLRGQSVGGDGVAGSSDTGAAFRGTSDTGPGLHVNITDVGNTTDLALFHRDDNLGLEIQNDGGAEWTTATGAQTTATNLPVFGTATKGVVPASGGGTTNFLRADGTFAAPSGSGITALTGDVTATGPGSASATIANDAVTNAKAANMAQSTVKMRAVAAGTGDPIDGTPDQLSTLLDAATDPFTRTSDLGAYVEDGDVLVTGLGFPSDGLSIFHPVVDAALVITPTDITVDRTLTIDPNDADRTLTLAGDATISGTNTGDVTLGTANGLSLVGQALSLGLSSTSTTGALNDTDWDTFNNKQAAITFGTGVQTALGVNVGSAGAPVLFNGAGGTPSSLTGTNITGTASGLTAGNVTTNANLTGPITSVGNATTIADAELAAIAALTSAANKTIQFTGSGTAALQDFHNPGSQTLAATVTFTAGLAPATPTNTYNWTQIGNMVTYQFSLTYASAGTTVTNVLIAFPSDMPSPFEQSGLTAASDNLYPLTLRATNGDSGASTNNSTGSLRRNSGDSAYEFNVPIASGTYSNFFLFGSYFTN